MILERNTLLPVCGFSGLDAGTSGLVPQHHPLSSTEKIIYGECCKISNTFLFLYSNKMLGFRAGIHEMLVRTANREDPDQTASSEAV